MNEIDYNSDDECELVFLTPISAINSTLCKNTIIDNTVGHSETCNTAYLLSSGPPSLPLKLKSVYKPSERRIQLTEKNVIFQQSVANVVIPETQEVDTETCVIDDSQINAVEITTIQTEIMLCNETEADSTISNNETFEKSQKNENDMLQKMTSNAIKNKKSKKSTIVIKN